jgi:acetyltransferase-like isoleucine patch superfamily enzyme
MQQKQVKTQIKESSSFRDLDLTRTCARDLIKNASEPWEALISLHSFIYARGNALPFDEFDEIADNLWVHVSAYLSPAAHLRSPCIICAGAQISHGACVSGSIIGSAARIGENSIVKNSLLFDRVRLVGNNFVDTSLIGYAASLSASVSLSATRGDGAPVICATQKGSLPTDRARLGSIVCDGATVGENAVLAAGSYVCPHAAVPPLTCVTGYYGV